MLILASSSPRRKEILSQYFDSFKVVVSDVDERALNLSPDKMSLDLAKQKGNCVYAKHPNDIIIACDTIVIFNNEIFNKPIDKNDAKRMLKALSGNKHSVLSSYIIISKDIEIAKTVKSTVYFNELDDKLIEEYIKTGSPLDKAGAYGIQDECFCLVKKIIGSFNNVKGLPIEEILKDFKKYKITI